MKTALLTILVLAQVYALESDQIYGISISYSIDRVDQAELVREIRYSRLLREDEINSILESFNKSVEVDSFNIMVMGGSIDFFQVTGRGGDVLLKVCAIYSDSENSFKAYFSKDGQNWQLNDMGESMFMLKRDIVDAAKDAERIIED